MKINTAKNSTGFRLTLTVNECAACEELPTNVTSLVLVGDESVHYTIFDHLKSLLENSNVVELQIDGLALPTDFKFPENLIALDISTTFPIIDHAKFAESLPRGLKHLIVAVPQCGRTGETKDVLKNLPGGLLTLHLFWCGTNLSHADLDKIPSTVTDFKSWWYGEFPTGSLLWSLVPSSVKKVTLGNDHHYVRN